jgi:hypothetical protein
MALFSQAKAPMLTIMSARLKIVLSTYPSFGRAAWLLANGIDREP